MKERSFDFSKVNRVFVWWTILCRGSHLVITSLSIFVTVKAFKSSKGRLDFNFAAWEVHSSLSKSLVPHFLEEERLLKLYKTPRESVLSLNKIVVQAGCRKTSIWIFRFSCRVLSDFYIVKKKKKRRRVWICKYASSWSCYFQIRIERKREREKYWIRICMHWIWFLDGKNKNYITYMFKKIHFLN